MQFCYSVMGSEHPSSVPNNKRKLLLPVFGGLEDEEKPLQKWTKKLVWCLQRLPCFKRCHLLTYMCY